MKNRDEGDTISEEGEGEARCFNRKCVPFETARLRARADDMNLVDI